MSAAPELPAINDFVTWHAERRPHETALRVGGRSWSYVDLKEAIDRLARALLAAGIVRGDRVATLQTPHPSYVIALLATASVGGIWIGLNPRYRLGELRHVLSDAEPKLLIARSHLGDRDYAADLAELRLSCPSIEQLIIFDEDPVVAGGMPMADFLTGGDSVAQEALSEARKGSGGRTACLIVYTSGSTGRPKGAVLHHEGISAFSVAQNKIWPLKPHRVLNYFPINHIGSVVDLTMPSLAAGGTVIFMEDFDPAGSLALMEREGVTLWGSVPSVFQMQLALPDFAGYDLSAVQLIIWEGAAMPQELVLRLLSVCPRLATNYGMTETTSAITVVEPTDEVELLANSVGHAFPGVEIRLVDAAGRTVADGTEGEVQARSRLNLLGYWRQPDATEACFTSDGFFRTGDLAVRRSDGRYRLVGRLKEMYKSGGYNIYPREIEAVLERHPAVGLAAVVARPDPLWDEVGVAYVAPAAEIRPEELEQHCRAHLASYKVPKAFVLEPNLPLLPIGKVDKQELARRARGLPA